MKQLKLILLMSMLSSSTFAITRYVSPTGSGTQDGTSWTNAAPGSSLQIIINASTSGDVVWVACGTYTTTSTTNRNISFSMKNGVALYGSFSGNETTLSQRNFTCGPCSILTGEIGISGNSDNSYHVISNPAGLDNTSIIDGFVIQDANDDRTATLTNGLGGGIYNNGGGASNICNPTIRNCVIRNNSAQFGAGIFNSGHTSGTSSPIIVNCIITNNTAYIGGGGIDNFGLNGVSSPTITNSLIYSNSALQRAGGMYCWGGNNGNANPNVLNCVFANNTAVNGGGVVSDRENSPSGTFSGNSNPIIFNSVFWNNTASGIGPQFFLIGGATFNATYSDVDLSGQTSPHLVTGASTGNLNTNPLFVNILNAIGIDNCWLTSDDGLQLLNSSPLINSGNLSGAPILDILGATRIGNPDIGAYEYGVILNVIQHDYATINIYPNPAFDEITIDFADDLNHVIQIIDTYGNLINLSKAKKNETINLVGYSSGLYLIKIDDRQATKVIKK
jgi:hypothetical protein